MVINSQICIITIFLLNALTNVNSKPAYIESVGSACDYEELGTNTRNVPIILSEKSQRTAFAGKPIYVAPDFNDILDQQTYNVYHEEVHGTILMPRVKFSLNNGDDCIKESDDYYDYGTNGINTRYLETRPRTLRRPSMRNPYRYARYPMSRVDPNAAVKVDFGGSHNPTIEEMVPYMRRRHTPDTYIVMVDDPVLVVDTVPNCSNETGNSTTTTTAASAAASDSTPTTTAAPAARRKRQAPAPPGGGDGAADKVLQAVSSGAGGGSGGKGGKGGGSDPNPASGGFGGFGSKRRKRSPNGGLHSGHRRNIRAKRSPEFEFDMFLMQAQNATHAVNLTQPNHSVSSTTTGKPQAIALPQIGK